MPRKPKVIKRPVGNPPKVIDWDVVDDFLITGCNGTKIADAIGVHPDTLYDRCESEKGVNWSAYLQQKKHFGDALLHKAQFEKAIGKRECGDSSLLIHLGKTRLDQRESLSVTVAPEIEKNYTAVMSQLDEMQKLRHNVSSEKPNDTTNESSDN